MAGLTATVVAAVVFLAPGATAATPSPQPAAGFTVSGRVESTSGTLPPALVVMVFEPTAGGSRGVSCDLLPDGRFVARDLTPGTYILEAGPSPEPEGRPAGERGYALVAVHNRDVDGVVIRTAPGGTVRGRVRFDEARRGSTRPAPVTINAMLAVADWHGPAESAALAEDGSFELRDLRGPRIIRVGYGMADDGNPWWFSQALLGDRDITNEAVDFSAGVTGELVIVFTQRPTAVVGRVEDVAGLSMPGACVVLLPENPDLQHAWSTAVGARAADQRGRFYFTSMPAGDYRLAAYRAADCPTAREVLDLADDIARVGSAVRVNDGSVARVIVSGELRPLRP